MVCRRVLTGLFAGACLAASAQDAPVDVSGNIGIESISSRTTLDRETRELTSIVLLRVANTSAVPVYAPLHIVFDTHTNAVRMPGAEGGAGTSPYDAYFHALNARLPGGALAPAAECTFTATFVRAAGVDFHYTATPYGTLAGRGYLAGEVYDDSRGLPLEGVAITLTRAGGQVLDPPQELVTDARGRYEAWLASGRAALTATKEGFSRSFRSVEVGAAEVAVPLDIRLTPLGAATSVNSSIGGRVILEDEAVALDVEAGDLGQTAEVGLTPLSAQSLPGELPPGWSPVTAVGIEPSSVVPRNTCELELRGIAGWSEGSGGGGENRIVAQWDPERLEWIRIEGEALSPGTGVVASLSALGEVVVLDADAGVGGPAVPGIGESLSGCATGDIPEGASLVFSPSPRVLFAQTGAVSEVAVSLAADAELPSGTRVQVHLAEHYSMSDGSGVAPDGMIQDIVLHRSSAGLQGSFRVSPSADFEPASLLQGVILLEGRDPADGSGTVLDAAGGTLTTGDGVVVGLDGGAATGSVPVSAWALQDEAPGLDGVTFEAGVEVSFGGLELSAPARLSVTSAPPEGDVTAGLVVSPVAIAGATRYEWVAFGDYDGGAWSVSDDTRGLPLPGVVAGGRYYFITTDDPVGYTTGAVTDNGALAAQAMAEADTLDLVSLTDSGDARYALAAPVGAVTVTARSLTDAGLASTGITISADGAVVSADLELSNRRPEVSLISPADASRDAAVTATVRAQFSADVDASSVSTQSFALLEGGANVAGSVELLADGRTAVFRPALPLDDETEYTVRLSTDILDVYGNALLGNQPDESFASTFTTVDTSPPRAPAAGEFAMSVPDADGYVTVTGTHGAAEPGGLVSIVNDDSGAIASVPAGVDGSFSVRVPATTADELTLVLRDLSGNETRVPAGVFYADGQTAVVPVSGGTMITTNGLEIEFPTGTFATPAEVTVQRIEADEVPMDIPTNFGMTFVAGFRIDTGDRPLQTNAYLKVDVPGPLDTNGMYLVCRAETNVANYELLDVAEIVDGRLEVRCYPFLGITGYLGVHPLVMMWVPVQSSSFIMGEVYLAPKVGTLAIQVDATVTSEGAVTVRADATSHHTDCEVTSLTIFDASDVPIGSGSAAGESALSFSASVPHEPSLSQTNTSWIGGTSRSVSIEGWRAVATFVAGNISTTLEASVFTRVLGEGDTPTPGEVSASHAYFFNARESERPAVGAWVDVSSGLAGSYPSTVRVGSNGAFIVAASVGTAYLRVYDPLTGDGAQFPVYVPAFLTDYADVGRIYVPEGFGDTQPPTVMLQVSGQFVPGESFAIDVTATDDQGIQSITLRVQGEFWGSVSSAGSLSTVYVPTLPGEYAIEAVVVDTAGNSTTRRSSVSVQYDYTDPTNTCAVTFAGGCSLEDGSQEVSLLPGIYLAITSGEEIEPGTTVEGLSGEDVYFQTATGVRVAADGGVVASYGSSAYLYIKPAYALPPNTAMELVAGGTVIHFTTAAPAESFLPGFEQIRDVAVYDDMVFVADFGTPDYSIHVVDCSDFLNPVLRDMIAAAGGARALDVGERLVVDNAPLDAGLVVVGGGNSTTLPWIRLYDLANPSRPERIGSGALHGVLGQAIPSEVEVDDGMAYVCNIGAGVQAVDLSELVCLSKISMADRAAQHISGLEPIVSGFLLPNASADPPILGDPYDVATGAQGLLFTGGGAGARLHVLPRTYGLLGDPIDAENPLILSQEIHGLAAADDYTVKEDLNGDGVADYRNITLLAASHGMNAGSRGITLIDASDPADPVALGSVDVDAMDLAIAEGFLFTSDRIISIYDPANAAPSDPLPFMTFGGPVDVYAGSLVTGGQRDITVASASADRKTLQLASIRVPTREDTEWDIVRTTAYEPVIHRDNLDYLNTGDPVNPFSGEFMTSETDLHIPGRGMDFAFTRTYRSRIQYNGVIGCNWDHSYNQRLTIHDDGDVTWYDGEGRGDLFEKTVSGDYESPRGRFSVLALEDDGRYRLTHPDGMTLLFESTAQDPSIHFRLTSVADLSGNALTFHYDGEDHLTRIRETMGRDVTLSYDHDGRLTAVRDWNGRTISYRYDAAGNLMSVTGPAAAPDFPSGKTTRYGYAAGYADYAGDGSSQSSAQLNHNLTSITDPAGQTYLVNTYYPTEDEDDLSFDRLWKQTLGGNGAGGEFEFSYQEAGGVVVARTENRAGHVTRRTYTEYGELETLVVETAALGSLTTDMEYSDEGLLTYLKTPRGMETTYTYNRLSASRLRQADLLSESVEPAGGGTPRLTAYTYAENSWGTPATVTDPMGHVTANEINAEGLVEAVTYPAVTQADGSAQSIIERFRYDQGLPTFTVDGVGTVTRYAYDTLPDGTLGYPSELVRDASVGPYGDTDGYDLRGVFTVNLAGQVESSTDPRGLTTTFDYNSLNQVVTESNWRGMITRTYDANDNEASMVRERTGLNDVRLEYGYNYLCIVTSRQERAGALERTYYFDHDANENLVRTVLPLGHEATNSYDERGLLTATCTEGGADAVDALTEARFYDADGNLVRVEDAEGEALVHTYNGFNELETTTDPNGIRTIFGYDARGLLCTQEVRDASSRLVARTTRDRDALGRVRELREAVIPSPGAASTGDRVTQYIYDGAGRVTRLRELVSGSSNWRITQYGYDALGRQTSMEDAAGNEIQNRYSSDGLDLEETVERHRLPDGSYVEVSTEFDYDSYGRLEEKRYAAGTADEQVTTYTYDSEDRLVEMAEEGGKTVIYTYDDFGRSTGWSNGREEFHQLWDDEDRIEYQRDADGHDIVYGYDGRGRLTRATVADGSYQSRSYNDDDTLARIVDRAGNVLDYCYDDGNRLTRIQAAPLPAFAAGTTERRFEYDALGRVTTGSSTSSLGRVEVTRQYNSLGDRLSETRGSWTLSKQYSLLGECTNIAYPSGRRYAQSVDALGRVSNVRRVGGGTISTHAYAGVANVMSNYFGHGGSVARTFDAAFREATRTYRSPASVLQTGYSFRYDEPGRLIGIARDHDGGAGDAFAYSAESWLADSREGVANPLADDATNQPADTVTRFEYDARGNWTNRTVNGTPEIYEVNDLNQYETAGTDTLLYDANGNLTNDGTQVYVYDAFGQLTQVREAAVGTVLAEYAYDAFGRRILESTAGGDEQYIYDEASEIAAYDGGGSLVREYVYGAAEDRPVLMSSASGDALYYQYDAHGSVAALADDSGSLVERYDYDAYGTPSVSAPDGTPRARSAVGNKLGYTGQPWNNDTRLVHMGAREYSPELGRFLQPDPLGPADGLNLYGYAGGDPVNYYDPSGLYREASMRKVSIHSGLGPDSFVKVVSDALWTVDAANLAYGLVRAAPTLVRGVVQLSKVLRQPGMLRAIISGKANIVLRIAALFGRGGALGAAGAEGAMARYLARAEAGTASELLGRGRAAPVGLEKTAECSTALVKYDPVFATKQILGDHSPAGHMTPGGRAITPHAAGRMVEPPAGRVPMTKADVDMVLDRGTKIRKIAPHPAGTTVTVQHPGLPGKPQVVVDAETGQRVVTVINPKKR